MSPLGLGEEPYLVDRDKSAVKVTSVDGGSGGLTNEELRATPVPVAQSEPVAADCVAVSADSLNTDEEVQLIAAPGSNHRWMVTFVLVTNASADTGTTVEICDEDYGSDIAFGYAAPGGGFLASYAKPLPVLPENKALVALCGTAGASVCVTVHAYKQVV